MTSDEETISFLLVEDDPEDEALVILTAGRNGLKFRHCRVDNAADFNDQLSNDRWDLIISDHQLPTFSASKVLDILKQNALDIPCIVISGCIDEAAAVSLLKAGAHDFIPKNNLSRLVPAIRREVAEARNRLQKRNAENSLRRQEKLLAGIAWALGEGLVVSNAQGEIIFVNPEAESLLGWEASQLLGKKLYQTIYIQNAKSDSSSERRCKITRFTTQGVPIRSEQEQFVRKDGSIFPVSYVSTQILEDDNILAVVTAFRDITERKQAELALIKSRSQLRELLNFQQEILEQERTRIARELHDELGQALTALKMDVAWMMPRLSREQIDLSTKANSMLKLIESTVDSVRRIAANLRPTLLDDLGLSAAAEWLLDDFQKRTGVSVVLDSNLDETNFDPALTTTLFRILQETLTNVARHAQASQLKVTMKDQDQTVILTVADNGIGFDIQQVNSKPKSFGLLGIRERVNSIGGVFEMISQLGNGAELRVTLPKTLANKAEFDQ